MSASVPPRPDPPRRWGETLQAWLTWFGVGRLVASALSVVVVVAGVGWLVRSPAPPTEAGLPTAAPDPTVGATLPPPTAALSDEDATADPATSLPVDVVVHVAGAVRLPGVYRLAADDRVLAAIDAAGGPSMTAELDGLNLAAPLRDGARIYVPAEGEVDPAEVPSWMPSASAVDAGLGDAATGPVDLNVASAEQLEVLPGIGPATASAIVDDRERHGPFASVDDLQRVPGIGPSKLAAVIDLVTV